MTILKETRGRKRENYPNELLTYGKSSICPICLTIKNKNTETKENKVNSQLIFASIRTQNEQLKKEVCVSIAYGGKGAFFWKFSFQHQNQTNVIFDSNQNKTLFCFLQSVISLISFHFIFFFVLFSCLIQI